MRLRMIALGLAVILLPLFASTGIASATAPTNTPVNASAAQVARYLFVAGDVGRLSMIPSGTESLVLEKVLQQLYAANPSLDPHTAASDIQTLQSSLQSISPDTLIVMGGNQRILAILHTLSASNPTGAVSQALSQVIDHALNDTAQSTLALGQHFNPSADSMSTIAYSTFSPAQTLADSTSLAAGNQSFGQARDLLWKQASHESVFDDAQTLLAENPALENDAIKGFMALVGADGSLSTTAGTLEGLIKNSITQIGNQTCRPADGTTGTSPSDCASGALHDAEQVTQQCTSGDSQACTDAKNQTQDDAGPEITKIGQQRTAATAAAVALGSADPGLEAAEIAEAQAASDVAYDESQYLDYATIRAIEQTTIDVAKLGIGLASAEINPLGAISALLSVVGDTTGYAFANPDATILQSIQDVSRQLAAFEHYTSIAIESVDLQIGALSKQLSTEFQSLSAQLTGISDTLTSLGGQLSTLQSSIDRLDADVQALFAQGAQNSLVQGINTYLGYAQKNPGQALTYQQFNDAAELFLTHATTIATSVTELKQLAASDFSAQGANGLLTGSGAGTLDSDINLFNYFPGDVNDSTPVLGWPDSSQSLASTCGSAAAPQNYFCLPNPSYWALAAQAYAQLLMENPQFVNSSRLGELQRIVADGKTISDAMARLSANDAGPDGGTPPGTGNKLLDAAVAYYRYWGGVAPHAFGTTPSLSQVLQAEEDTYLKSQNAAGVDPWGGPKQSPDENTLQQSGSFTKIPLCTAFAQSLGSVIDPNKFVLPKLPVQMIAFLPVQVQNAVRLGIGRVQPCWQAAFSGWHLGSDQTVHGTLSMEVSYNYVSGDGTLNETVGIAQGSIDVPDCTGTAQNSPLGETQGLDDLLGINAVIDDWPGVSAPNGNCVDMSLVLGDSSNEHPFYPSDVSAAVEPAVNTVLGGLQRGVYNDMLSALQTNDGGVRDAAERWGGASALLNGYVSLGLPQSLATDDTLRGLIDGTGANPFTPSNISGTPLLQVAPAPEGTALLQNVYKAALNQMPSADPIGDIGLMVDNRAINLFYALHADIVPSAQNGARATAARLGSAAAAQASPARSQANALISPALDRLNAEDASLTDATTDGVPLRVSLGGPGSGSVSGSGISCPSSCSGSYPPGTTITLSPSPASGWAFTGWSGACSGIGPCTFTMGLFDTRVTATFGPPVSATGGPGTPAGPGGSATNPVAPPAAPKCTLRVLGRKVLLAKHRGKHASKQKPGTLSVTLSCDQATGVTLGGRVIRLVGKKPSHGKQRTVTTRLAQARRSVKPGAKMTLTVKLPAGAVTRLGQGAKESVTFTLVATNGNGTYRVSVTAGPLKGTH
jgi:hypothetical protein